MLHRKRDFFRQNIRKEYFQNIFRHSRIFFNQPNSQNKTFKQIQNQIFAFKENKLAKNFKTLAQLIEEIQIFLSIQNKQIAQRRQIFQFIVNIFKRFQENKINNSFEFASQEIEERQRQNIIYKTINLWIRLPYHEVQKHQIIQLYIFLQKKLKKQIKSENKQLICLYFQAFLKFYRQNNCKTQQTLKELGIGIHINDWIDASYRNLSQPHHEYLLELTYLFLGCEKFSQQDQISLEGFESVQKQKKLIYCTLILNSKQNKIISCALNCIKKLLQLHSYLVSSISFENVKFVCNLMFHPFRDVQKNAIDCLGQIIYHDPNYTDQLLKQNYLPDCLLQLLLHQQQQPNDQISRDLIIYCKNMLCNLTLTQNNKLKKALCKHHIWNFAYENLQPFSKYFILVISFEYYFAIAGRTNILLMLDAFLGAISCIDIQSIQIGQRRSIENSLSYIYKQANQFWPEQNFQYFMHLLQNYNLKQFLEQIMDLQTNIA